MVQALEHAAALSRALDLSHPLRSRVPWKLAKALLDFDVRTPLEALKPELQAGVDLFFAYGTARTAAQRVARHHQDRWGYDAPELLLLWTQLQKACSVSGDDHGADLALLDRAWCHMCRGDLATMHADLESIRSSDDAVLLSKAYTVLCGANWSLDAAGATGEVQQIQTLLEGPPPLHLEIALAEAALRFELDVPRGVHDDAYLAALRSRSGFSGLAAARRVEGPEFYLATAQSAGLVGLLEPTPDLWGCRIFAPSFR